MKEQERFLTKFKELDNGCWEWQKGVNSFGYAQFQAFGRNMRGHIYAYEYYIGKIPKDLHLDHLCRNRKCVNPKHLEPITNKQNILRGVGVTAINAKKKNCKYGHPLKGENLYLVKKTGCRQCRQCKKGRLASLRRKKGIPIRNFKKQRPMA